MKNKLITFLLAVNVFFCAGISSAAEKLTVDQLAEKIRVIHDGTNDIHIKIETQFGSSPASTSTMWYKRPHRMLLKGDGGSMGGYSILTEVKGDKAYTYSYTKGSEAVEESIMPHDLSQPEYLPDLGTLLFRLEEAREKGKPIQLEELEDQEGVFWKVTIDPLGEEQGLAVNFFLRSANWQIFKTEMYKDGKLIMTTKTNVVSVNAGLAEDIFKLGAPEGTPVVQKQNFIESVENIQAGWVTPDSITKTDKESCSGCREDAICTFLKSPESIRTEKEIPAALGVGFGFSYELPKDFKGDSLMATTKFFYPPMTNPSTGQIKTQESSAAFITAKKINTVGWNFDYEWELVPGEWKIQLLNLGATEPIVERTFTVVVSEDAYRYKPALGKKILAHKQYIFADPENAMKVKNLGNTYLDAKDYDSAIAQYNKALALKEHAWFYNNLCIAWHKKGENDRAIRHCDKAIELLSPYNAAYVNRGAAYLAKKNYDQAHKDFEEALRTTPEGELTILPFLYEQWSKLDNALKDYSSAVKHLTLAIKYNPGNTSLIWSRANAYKALDMKNEALVDYKKYLKLNPDCTSCQKAIEELDL